MSEENVGVDQVVSDNVEGAVGSVPAPESRDDSSTEQGQIHIMTELFRGMESRLMRAVEERLANFNMPVAGDPPPRPPSNPRQTPISPRNFAANIDQFRFSDVNFGVNTTQASKIAPLIKSWDIKFDGSPRLPVESFIYRIESQVADTLGGNFDILCEHVQSLFANEAKDWYWRYRRTVAHVTWPSLCIALRTNFADHKTDAEIREAIRARKQRPNECFDDYRNAVYKISEPLEIPLTELEWVDILQRGLKPKVRQQLLYVTITSVAQLRRLCLKGEGFFSELSKSIQQPQIPQQIRHTPRQQVSDIDLERDQYFDKKLAEIDKKRGVRSLKCWNCRQDGHRFSDCLKKRTVFCYGCGTVDVYKPTCPKCKPGNSEASEKSRTASRQEPLKSERTSPQN